jgi:hypothetical protein
MAEDLENVNVGHYRSLDLPKNLALRYRNLKQLVHILNYLGGSLFRFKA